MRHGLSRRKQRGERHLLRTKEREQEKAVNTGLFKRENGCKVFSRVKLNRLNMSQKSHPSLMMTQANRQQTEEGGVIIIEQTQHPPSSARLPPPDHCCDVPSSGYGVVGKNDKLNPEAVVIAARG
jgi:hypothetical protein